MSTTAIMIRLMLVFWVIFGGLIVLRFWEQSDDSDFDYAMAFIATVAWLLGVICGVCLNINQMQKSVNQINGSNTATVAIDADDSDAGKKPAELKHSNVKVKNGKYYVDELLLADTAKNGKIIPRNRAGRAMVSMLTYLKQKHVIKTCTGLKVNVQASGTKARYFSENGKKLVAVQATNSNKVVETNEDF